MFKRFSGRDRALPPLTWVTVDIRRVRVGDTVRRNIFHRIPPRAYLASGRLLPSLKSPKSVLCARVSIATTNIPARSGCRSQDGGGHQLGFDQHETNLGL